MFNAQYPKNDTCYCDHREMRREEACEECGCRQGACTCGCEAEHHQEEQQEEREEEEE